MKANNWIDIRSGNLLANDGKKDEDAVHFLLMTPHISFDSRLRRSIPSPRVGSIFMHAQAIRLFALSRSCGP
jgi:hypothetical protein